MFDLFVFNKEKNHRKYLCIILVMCTDNIDYIIIICTTLRKFRADLINNPNLAAK